MGKRQRTTKKRKNYLRIGKNPDRCPNCGEYGPHFVPPSFGDKGFFICPSCFGPKRPANKNVATGFSS